MCVLFIALWMLPEGLSVGQAAGTGTVPYKLIPMSQYQNCLNNWDDKKHPILFALVQSKSQYDALFHPAPVLGDRKPFAPDPTVYKDHLFLVLGRTCTFSDVSQLDRFFTVRKVTSRGSTLTLSYSFRSPHIAPRDAATFKTFLVLQIPRAAYRTVNFIENGKSIGRLKPMNGLWSVPEHPETYSR